MRNFFGKFQKNFFAHYFRNHKFFGLVGNDIFRNHLFALRKSVRKVFFKLCNISTFSCRDGKNVAVDSVFVQQLYIRRDIFLWHYIYFCIGNRHRDIAVRVTLDKRDIAVGNSAVTVVDEQNEIDVLCRGFGGFHHFVGKFVF